MASSPYRSRVPAREAAGHPVHRGEVPGKHAMGTGHSELKNAKRAERQWLAPVSPPLFSRALNALLRRFLADASGRGGGGLGGLDLAGIQRLLQPAIGGVDVFLIN